MRKCNFVNIRLIARIVLVLFLCAMPFSKNNYAQDIIGESTRQIVEGRENVKGYVADITDKHKPGTPEYKEARKKYRTALAKFNGWAASVKRSIRQGKAKDLQKDASYKAAATEADTAANDFVSYVESKSGAKGGLSIVGILFDSGIKIWNAVKDRKDLDRQRDADAFYEDVKWDQWEVLIAGIKSESRADDDLIEEVEEVHLGDPPTEDEKGVNEFLMLNESELTDIEEIVSGDSRGPKVDNKLLAMETLRLSKEYVRMGVTRKEPPSPTKVKGYLALYGLPFRYGGNGQYVPYCAAGVGFAAARAYTRLTNDDAGDNFVKLRNVLSDVTRDYTKTHPATNFMMSAAKNRKYPNGESYWVPHTQRPQKGWLVFFNWSGRKSKTQHVGIVDSVDTSGRILSTVEYNTSDTNPSNGGKVVEKTRSVRYVVGYIRTYPSNN